MIQFLCFALLISLINGLDVAQEVDDWGWMPQPPPRVLTTDCVCAEPFGCSKNSVLIADGGELDGYYYTDFHVISFGDFFSLNGDVEGRLLVGGNFEIDWAGGFSVGDKLVTWPPTPIDNQRPYSLVVALNITCFQNGIIQPRYDGYEEWIFAQNYLEPKNCTPYHQIEYQKGYCEFANSDCLRSTIDDIEAYYTTISQNIYATTQTARYTKWYGGGIKISFKGTAGQDVYIKIPNSVWNSAEYVIFEDIDIVSQTVYVSFVCDDTEPTKFWDGQWPGKSAKTVFNWLGEGPQIMAMGSIEGTVLAPGRTLNQTTGAITGAQVIVRDVVNFNQANKQLCCCEMPCGGTCCEEGRCCVNRGGDEQCCTGSQQCAGPAVSRRCCSPTDICYNPHINYQLICCDGPNQQCCDNGGVFPNPICCDGPCDQCLGRGESG